MRELKQLVQQVNAFHFSALYYFLPPAFWGFNFLIISLILEVNTYKWTVNLSTFPAYALILKFFSNHCFSCIPKVMVIFCYNLAENVF